MLAPAPLGFERRGCDQLPTEQMFEQLAAEVRHDLSIFRQELACAGKHEPRSPHVYLATLTALIWDLSQARTIRTVSCTTAL